MHLRLHFKRTLTYISYIRLTSQMKLRKEKKFGVLEISPNFKTHMGIEAWIFFIYYYIKKKKKVWHGYTVDSWYERKNQFFIIQFNTSNFSIQQIDTIERLGIKLTFGGTNYVI